MKFSFITRLAFVLVVTVSLAACDLFEDAGDVSFDSPIEGSFVISETASAQNKAYTETLVVNTNDNDQIKKYESKIKDIQVNRISIKITDYTGDDTNATVNASYESGTTTVQLGTLNVSNLKSLAASGTAVEIPVTDAQLKLVADILKQNKTMTFLFNGTLSKTPVTFTVRFVIDAKVTAEAF